MKLLDFLAETGESMSEFARRAGLEVSTVWRVANGKTFPRARVAQAIAAATDNKVMPNDYLDVEAA